jgi:hypothetical protein
MNALKTLLQCGLLQHQILPCTAFKIDTALCQLLDTGRHFHCQRSTVPTLFGKIVEHTQPAPGCRAEQQRDQ